MNTEPITTTQTETEQQGARRWPRLAMLGLTLVGPAVGTALQRLRRQAETTTAALSETAQARQGDLRDLRERLDELTDESRERIAQQVQYLRSQARQLQTQSRQLGKAARQEARQRRKWLKRAREAGLDWGQEMSRDLAERGRKITHAVADRGEELLEPAREHSRLWAVVGFAVGMIAAGAITYRLVRGRSARQQAEDESIELRPTTPFLHDMTTQPVGAGHTAEEETWQEKSVAEE